MKATNLAKAKTLSEKLREKHDLIDKLINGAEITITVNGDIKIAHLLTKKAAREISTQWASQLQAEAASIAQELTDMGVEL